MSYVDVVVNGWLVGWMDGWLLSLKLIWLLFTSLVWLLEILMLVPRQDSTWFFDANGFAPAPASGVVNMFDVMADVVCQPNVVIIADNVDLVLCEYGRNNAAVFSHRLQYLCLCVTGSLVSATQLTRIRCCCL